MISFLLVFFTVYGSMNAYILFWVQRSYPLKGFRLAGFVLFLLLMITGFVLVRVLESGAAVPMARVLAYLCYVWMAVALWFLFLGLMADMWNLGIWGLSRLNPDAILLFLPYRTAIKFISILIMGVCIWSVVEGQWMRTEKITVRTPSLPSGARPVTIAQISDIHLGLIEGKKRLDKIFRILDENNPDMLVATGDLVDGMAPHLNHLSDLLARRKPPLGKFAVMGNHEFYAGIEESVRFHELSGFTVLRAETVDVGSYLRVAGVDDPAGHRFGSRTGADEEMVLSGDPGRFTILLKHQPLTEPGSLGRFDLQLSGHTHKGQIYPFYHLVKMRYPMVAGLYEAGQGSRVYVSRGSGTWGPPMRFLSPPEVTIFTLLPED